MRKNRYAITATIVVLAGIAVAAGDAERVVSGQWVGTQVIYTAACRGAAPKVVTTSYHGTSSDGIDSTGGKTTAKRVGPCK